MQTSFPEFPDAAVAGQIADSGADFYTRSGLNENAAAIPYGLLVKEGSEDDGFDLYSASAKPAGVTVHSHASALADNENPGVQADSMCELMRRGRIQVTVEDAVTKGARAYARHTSDGGSNTQKGKFRSDNDGVSQVTTVTPTSANSTKFALDVFVNGKLFPFTTTSDGSSSATEICDQFRTAMAADAAFSALITASGTATLILTGTAAMKGKAFQVGDGGAVGNYASITETTPASTRADEVEGCRFLSSADAGGLAVLEVNLPA